MRRAIQVAQRNPEAPFGALLVDAKTEQIVAEGVNRGSENPTWHGEIDVINRFAGEHPDAEWGGFGSIRRRNLAACVRGQFSGPVFGKSSTERRSLRCSDSAGGKSTFPPTRWLDEPPLQRVS